MKRVVNLSAGPSQLPLEVLEEAHKNFFEIAGTGISPLEIGHRSKVFENILNTAKADLIKLLNIPNEYDVLFMTGGGTGQFSMVPLNLITSKDDKPDYVITGRWSLGAYTEAKKYCSPNIVCNATDGSKFTKLPERDSWQWTKKPSYIYYCANETVDGVEFANIDMLGDIDKDVPVVCDMSSSILSVKVDVSKFGIIFAGAQKNSGVSGLTVVIIKKSLLNRSRCWPVPLICDYKIYSQNNSLYNTPPTYSIYIAGLVYKWILKEGGVEEMEKRAKEKSELMYSLIDSSNLYKAIIDDPAIRSRINIVFTVSPPNNKSLKQSFSEEGEKKGFVGMDGHRSVGGYRISLFNSQSVFTITKLVEFMKQFEDANQ